MVVEASLTLRGRQNRDLYGRWLSLVWRALGWPTTYAVGTRRVSVQLVT